MDHWAPALSLHRTQDLSQSGGVECLPWSSLRGRGLQAMIFYTLVRQPTYKPGKPDSIADAPSFIQCNVLDFSTLCLWYVVYFSTLLVLLYLWLNNCMDVNLCLLWSCFMKLFFLWQVGSLLDYHFVQLDFVGTRLMEWGLSDQKLANFWNFYQHESPKADMLHGYLVYKVSHVQG